MSITIETSMTYLQTSPLSQEENSVLPLEAYLKIQTLHVKNIIFIPKSYQPNDFITSL